MAAASSPGDKVPKSAWVKSRAASSLGAPDDESNKPRGARCDTKRRMKLFVKSRRPSFAPVPSSCGYANDCPDNASAASIQLTTLSDASPRRVDTKLTFAVSLGRLVAPKPSITRQPLRMAADIGWNRVATEGDDSGSNPSLLSFA